MNNFSEQFSKGFTLIELLVVIGVLGVLAAAVVIVLNPAELLAQARDGQRISDVDSIVKAISLYQEQNPLGSLGSSSLAYISYPSSSQTCSGLGLPAVGGGYTNYNCSATPKATNGNGWIPINLSSIPGGSPLGYLPLDPNNTTSSYYSYYTTTTGNLFEVASTLESQKYQSLMTNGLYQKGTSLSLAPGGGGVQDPSTISGLQLWLKADSLGLTNGASVSTWADSSGNGANATSNGGAAPTYATNVINGEPAVSLNGSNNSFIISTATSINRNDYSLFVVFVPEKTSTYQMIFDGGSSPDDEFIDLNGSGTGVTRYLINWRPTLSYAYSNGTPYLDETVSDPSAGLSVYSDDNFINSISSVSSGSHSTFYIGNYSVGSYWYQGYVAELILYNRPLTNSERQTVEAYIMSKYGI